MNESLWRDGEREGKERGGKEIEEDEKEGKGEREEEREREGERGRGILQPSISFLYIQGADS